MSRNSKMFNKLRTKAAATVLRAASRGRSAIPKAGNLVTDDETERMEATMAKSHANTHTRSDD